jgi:hypothetical protein
VGWKKSNEDAKDLTQAFFARCSRTAASRHPDRGRPLPQLPQAGARNFLIDADRAAEVRKPVEAVSR